MKEFIESGRFICMETFLYKNPTKKLLKDCTDVVLYDNGLYIQVLKSGLFYVDDNFSSDSLDKSEAFLLEKIKQ